METKKRSNNFEEIQVEILGLKKKNRTTNTKYLMDRFVYSINTGEETISCKELSGM